MLLPPEQTQRFYYIWWPLLTFVGKRLRLVSETLGSPEQPTIPVDTAFKIRNALWEDDRLLEAFIKDNPAALSDEDLSLVANWKRRLGGNFFVVRHLKKYSVFLDSSNPPRAYGVLGLVSPIEEIIGPDLPAYLQAVLLPFEDKIIYDSLLAPYRIHFGPNIRSDLNRAYRDAQESRGVITSLTAPDESERPGQARRAIEERNAKIVREFRKDLYRRGLSPKMAEQHTSNIETFGVYLAEMRPPQLLIDIDDRVVAAYLSSLDAKRKKALTTSLKRLARFLLESLRIDPETHWRIKRALE